MSRKVLFDTSVYVEALRRPVGVDLESTAATSELWLSAVVIEELYAGARPRDRRTIEVLERSFAADAHVLVPSAADWKQAGLLLANVAQTYGYEEIGWGRLTNDALIAVSSARCGASVVTLNSGDFGRLAEFHRFHWEVVKV